jgi:hypothetical protein
MTGPSWRHPTAQSYAPRKRHLTETALRIESKLDKPEGVAAGRSNVLGNHLPRIVGKAEQFSTRQLIAVLLLSLLFFKKS